MSLLKSLNYTALPRKTSLTPEQQRRQKLIKHLLEQMGMAKAAIEGTTFKVQKRRWEYTPDGEKIMADFDKRLLPWWHTVADGSLVLTIKWGSKAMEFERGKAGIAAENLAEVVKLLERFITATDAGELDTHISNINKLRIPGKKKAA